MNINRLGDHIAWQEIRSLTCDYQGFHGARLASALPELVTRFGDA